MLHSSMPQRETELAHPLGGTRWSYSAVHVHCSHPSDMPREILCARFLFHGSDHTVQCDDTPVGIDIDARKIRQVVSRQLPLNQPRE